VLGLILTLTPERTAFLHLTQMAGRLPPIFNPMAPNVGSGAFRRPIIQLRLEAVHANYVDGYHSPSDDSSDDSSDDDERDTFVIKALVCGILPSHLHAMDIQVGQTWFDRGMSHFPITVYTTDLPPNGPWSDPRFELKTRHIKKVVTLFRGCREKLSGNKVAVHLHNDAQDTQVKYATLCD
jgi:hypothetical protein